MVGRLTLNSKAPGPRESRKSDVVNPPPPYELKSNSPVFLAETTTTRTEVVTTTTTTHFFSLPLWRKRGNSPSGSVPQNANVKLGVGSDEHGLLLSSARSSTYLDEKDLPPTPPNEPEPLDGANQAFDPQRAEGNNAETRVLPVPHIPTDSRKPRVMSSTTALARAALGLGLPHILPHAPDTSTSSEINTIAFTSQAMPGTGPSSPRVRRAKSSQKFQSSRPATTVSSEQDSRRRSRGFSLGTNSFLDFGPLDTKGKGKARDIFEHPSPSKSISRRPSFWSRRRTTTPDATLFPTPQDTTQQHLVPLPTLPPVSPFQMNLASTPSPTPSSITCQPNKHIRGLSRSYSERARSMSAKSNPNMTTSIIPNIIVPSQHSKPDHVQAKHLSTVSMTLQSNISAPPGAPSPPRPRAYTNPTLSRVFFDATPPSANHRPHVASNNSAAHTLGNYVVNTPSSLKETESPEIYLQRLQTTVSKAEVAGILASSVDPFHVKALKTYIGRFNFIDDPLDVALRKLLMEVGLPHETQQIDRVMEAFAGRYLQCNPTLFTSDDHPYILAFSLIMLHTDAFNKSNKRKMSKADYIKNTRLPGVSPEILDCFYDNILFAPFIFIEDPLDVNGQHGLETEATTPLRIVPPSSNLLGNSNNSGQGIMRGAKIDPYYLIANKLLGPLRVNVEAYVPTDNPYSYEGTAGPWDETVLQRAFVKASEIEVGAADYHRAPPLFNITIGGGTASPSGTLKAHLNPASPSTRQGRTLKVTKAGLLNRKDDVLEGGKKASNRKWKTWSVILTGSQLLFFRDPTWSTSLLEQSNSADGRIIYPQSSVFKPDELLSVKDAVAVFDISYTKYENTFRFILSDGRQLLLQTLNENDLNGWISSINYASAFKSAGVRMRPMDMSGIDVKLTGVAAATSHLHDLQSRSTKTHHWDGDSPRELMEMLSGELQVETRPSAHNGNFPVVTGKDDTELDVPVAPEIDGADQFKATFDQVKADLAAGRWTPSDDDTWCSIPVSSENSVEPTTTSHIPAQPHHWGLPSRSRIMRSKVLDLESKINAAQSQLDTDMRFVRNIATLTPFQKSTRDRLTAVVQGVAKRIMQVRLEATKLACHRYVLLNDLASQERSWHRSKTIALRAATETLQVRRSGVIPQMTLSFHNEPSTITLPISLHHPNTSLTPSLRPESSACDSFHSAMDFGPGWPSSDDISSSNLLGASCLIDSPECSNSRSPSPITRHDTETGSGPTLKLMTFQNIQPHSDDASPRTSEDYLSHENPPSAHDIPEEQAEVWNETRCAHRVSLVKLPSDIQISTRFQRFNAQPPYS